MQSAAKEALDLSRESATVHKLDGLDDEKTRDFGSRCLVARRLVERGVRFVQLYDMPDKDGWDAHANLKENHTPRAAWTDQPMAALVEDLQ